MRRHMLSSAREMGFDHAVSSKAWMNEEVLRQWLYRFDTFIWKNTKRETLLLLGNAPFHGQIDTLSTFSYLRIKLLPKRTTPIVQPLRSRCHCLYRAKLSPTSM